MLCELLPAGLPSLMLGNHAVVGIVVLSVVDGCDDVITVFTFDVAVAVLCY